MLTSRPLVSLESQPTGLLKKQKTMTVNPEQLLQKIDKVEHVKTMMNVKGRKSLFASSEQEKQKIVSTLQASVKAEVEDADLRALIKEQTSVIQQNF
jgi:hypothetical protein